MLAPIQERYPLTARLEIHITAYSIHLIVAFITLPALIWHISSVHIHDDYGMPDDWIETFDKAHFTGGRGFLWAFLFVVVSIDCVHALLALDHYHARRYERGPEDDATDSVKAEERDRSASTSTATITPTSTSTSAAPISLPTRLSNPFLPPALSLALLTFYDILMTTVLLAHTVNFFHVIDTNWDACDTYVSPYPENFMDPLNTGMSVLARCRRICTDSYVSGAFDVAMSMVLVGVHVWHSAYRVWEGWFFGVERDDGIGGEEAVGGLDGSGEGRSLRSGRGGRGGRQGGAARSTAIRSRDWSQEGTRKGTRNTGREGSVATRDRDRSCSVESARWSEVLLECLVP
ncbi:hypothetical protein P171DRAFT_476361 [Karstenula rhodostoma CBS 690.94]|uniref:Uncharacterized protein n=1 Tax=Karstenula rhodostoma CBS 690.94 TaxID=1392251 RepID=A0A9P4P9J0_9PLEO|nr:hypothetical protein P171DRAFT_476361 [Karstenula rhodostoma CBS 690.94]